MKIGHNCDFSPRPTIFKKSKITLKSLLCKKYVTRRSSKVLKCPLRPSNPKLTRLLKYPAMESRCTVYCLVMLGLLLGNARSIAWLMLVHSRDLVNNQDSNEYFLWAMKYIKFQCALRKVDLGQTILCTQSNFYRFRALKKCSETFNSSSIMVFSWPLSTWSQFFISMTSSWEKHHQFSKKFFGFWIF